MKVNGDQKLDLKLLFPAFCSLINFSHLFVLYSIVLLYFDRTFLKELENSAEKPELVGTCFLKRVSDIMLMCSVKRTTTVCEMACLHLLSYRRKSYRFMRNIVRISHGQRLCGGSVGTVCSFRWGLYKHTYIYIYIHGLLFKMLGSVRVPNIFVHQGYIYLNKTVVLGGIPNTCVYFSHDMLLRCSMRQKSNMAKIAA